MYLEEIPKHLDNLTKQPTLLGRNRSRRSVVHESSELIRSSWSVDVQDGQVNVLESELRQGPMKQRDDGEIWKARFPPE